MKELKRFWTCRFLCGLCRIKEDSVGPSVYPRRGLTPRVAARLTTCHNVTLTCVSHIVARQRLGEHVPGERQRCYRRLFYVVLVVSKENRRLVLPRTSCCFCAELEMNAVI
jgi:hypothetical protein